MMAIETWLPIVGWEGLYEVSDRGRVKSMTREVSWGTGHRTLPTRIMALEIIKGYPSIRLRREGRGKHFFVHRLVLDAFVGPRPPGNVCCHGIGGSTINTLGNLKWDTQSENMRNTVRDGTNLNANKTHCPRHEYTNANTYIIPSTGSRSCRECAGQR